MLTARRSDISLIFFTNFLKRKKSQSVITLNDHFNYTETGFPNKGIFLCIVIPKPLRDNFSITLRKKGRLQEIIAIPTLTIGNDNNYTQPSPRLSPVKQLIESYEVFSLHFQNYQENKRNEPHNLRSYKRKSTEMNIAITKKNKDCTMPKIIQPDTEEPRENDKNKFHFRKMKTL